MKYTCTICNKEFESKHKASVCEECKTGICVICGKEFKREWPYTQKTCSSKCRGIYRKESGIAKQVADKSKETLMMRYGVTNSRYIVNSNFNPKKCKYCGKEFIPESPRQEYCKDVHYGPCPVCGKLTVIKDMNIGPQCCSEECRISRINKTCLEKYGNKDAVNSDHAKNLSRQHCIQRYGVDHYSKTDEYKSRYRKTMIERYGAPTVLESSELKQKSTASLLQNLGVDNPMKDNKVVEKMIETKMNKYSGLGFDSPELSERIRSTNLEKFGVEIPSQNESVRQKIANTCKDKYGSSCYLSSQNRYMSSMTDSTKYEEYMKFKIDPKGYIEQHYDVTTLTITKLCRDLGVTDTPIYSILAENNCSDLIHNKTSIIENDVIEYIQSLGISNIMHNTKTIIPPLELDIYLPDYNFAIECNPTITHNSSIVDPWGGEPKLPSYHKTKTNMCEKQQVQLFHIFGYEWSNRRSIIQSMISSRLHKSNTTIYGRDTNVVELRNEDCTKFLDENHKQGSLSSKIRLGLMYQEQIVGCMTFSKLRPTLGTKSNDTNVIEDEYELTRFCNKLNTNVVGGASKLLKYFIKEYNPKKLVSFSDRAHTSGKLYEILGFKQVSISEPGYVWVNLQDDSYLTRVKCQKRNLAKVFEDVTEEDIQNKTEKQIMIEHGYVQVFDSGVIRWELNIE